MKTDKTALSVCIRAILSQGGTDITVIPEDDGWRMMAISPDHVSMASVNLDRAAFPEGYAVCDRFTLDGHTLLGMIKGTGTCELAIGGGSLTVIDGSYRQRMRLLGDPGEGRRFPALESTGSATLAVSELLELLSKGEGITDSVVLTVGNGQLLGTVDNPDSGRFVSLTLESDMFLGEATACYPSGPFAAVLKALPKEAEVTLEWTDANPLLLVCAGEGWSVRWIVAPRIQED